jgi:mono/diheme cytochrome c family protein
MSPKVCRLRNGGLALVLAMFLLALLIRLACAAPPSQSAADGEAIFKDRCTGCHTIGGGRLVGPDLKGVTAQRDRAWLARFIAAPDTVLAAGDPTASALLQAFNNVQMPNLGLSQDQVAALIAYLDAQGGAIGTPSPPPTPASVLPAGDPGRGKALFMGDVHLRSDGPPCMGCHSIDRAGALGGGVMGPDLTPAFVKYGDAGLASVLANISFPAMKPIYAAHPLAPEEQADLRAFIQAESGQQQVNTDALVLGLSLAGFAAAMIGVGIVWRRRLRRVRRLLVEQPTRNAPGN